MPQQLQAQAGTDGKLSAEALPFVPRFEDSRLTSGTIVLSVWCSGLRGCWPRCRESRDVTVACSVG